MLYSVIALWLLAMIPFTVRHLLNVFGGQ